MKKSRLLVLGLAVAAAGGAFVLANSPKPAVVGVVAPPPSGLQSDGVLVASRDLPIGTIVADSDLSWQDWPKSGVNPGMIVKASDPRAVDDIKGSIARSGIYQGEPIHRDKLIKGTGTGFMSAILPAGMRAVAINIDAQGSTTAGGFILPNDKVDVIHTFQDPSKTSPGQGAVMSETILRNVTVLAIGQNIQDKNGQSVVVGSNATLELDPVQAETVVLAQRIGQLSLTLRSVQDANNDTQTADKADRSMTIVRYGTATEGEVR